MPIYLVLLARRIAQPKADFRERLDCLEGLNRFAVWALRSSF